MPVRALLIALAAALAVPGIAEARYEPFQSPSGAIRCAYLAGDGIAKQIRCDASFLNDRAAVLKVRGKARIQKVTDTVGDPEAPVLDYGESRRFGRLRCTSRRSGMRCRSTRSGHGFLLSRERQKVY